MIATDAVRFASFQRFPSALVQSFVRWLSDVPIDDAMDRRNAPTMQLLFALMGFTLTVSWARHFAAMEIAPRMHVLFGTDMVTVACSLVGIALIRRGEFRLAVGLYLASLLLGLLLSHAVLGYQLLAVDQTAQMLSLAVGGLVLGRRVLWMVFLVLMAVACAGFAADAAALARTGESTALAWHFLPSAFFSHFVVVVVLDRCITALRNALCESEARRLALQLESDERERTQARLLHAQKMETMGRLASGVAHDFNNVLGVVIGYADARHRIDDIGDDPREIARDMAEALEGIDASAQKGMELTRRLLCLGRRDAAQPVVLDAGELLSDMQVMLRRLLPRSIALSLDLPLVPLPVRLDRAQFEFVILDIASNARDAMPDGGELRVSATAVDGAAVERASVEMTFADTGHGMSAQDVARAFEPFFSTKPPGTGTGLGLAATLSVVERAGGTVALDSAPMRGTTVRIRLPREKQGSDHVFDEKVV
jgi:signal transduction histidine kinase